MSTQRSSQTEAIRAVYRHDRRDEGGWTLYMGAMHSELVLYTHPMSRGRTARWMLEEIGQPYRTEILGYGEDGVKGASFLAINPMGKVPAIKHGDVVVTETAAICAYLADAFPEAGLAPPPGDLRRGAYYRWLFFAAGPIEAAVTDKALGVVVAPERKRMAGYGSLDDVLSTLERTLEAAEFVAGDTFTAADLYLSAQLGWPMKFGMIERRPAFVAYCARVNDRPAALRARDLDDALLPPEQRTAGMP